MLAGTDPEGRAKALFDAYYGAENYNLFTPTVLAYYPLADGAVELSQGEGAYRQPIYGITVLATGPEGTRRVMAEGALCHSMEEAQTYIAMLQTRHAGNR